MATIREPVLQPISITSLRPTQLTVGMREVMAKRKRWREKGSKKGGEYLGKHMIPVVVGPKERRDIIEHHHLARALHEEGVNNVLISVVANLSKLEPDSFWFVMENRSWMHAYDDKGQRRDYTDIPKSVSQLVDDPFRSLAGELRRARRYAQDTTLFSEFLWADFLRRRIKRKVVERTFSHALERALELAKSGDAGYLPGWCGPTPDE